ncbi:MAG TPA: SgcJ/EcaC family oxidoreductase [Microvirga sp.]|nr:SgcJ/EcaC family oxidoreductase [Microvirga sp.]
MRRLALLAAFCVAAAIPGYAQDRAEFQRLADQWTEAFNKGDVARVSQTYAEDAILLPPEAEMVRGREAILAFWRKEAERIGDLKVTITDVKRLGDDEAHIVFNSTARSKGQQPQEVPGKGTTLVQKSGGDWRIATHVWNRNR